MIKRLKKYIMPFLLIFLIPQIANILICIMMSEKQLREIPTAVYLGDNTSLTRTIVNSFDEHETFDIKYFVEDPYEIEELMKQGKILFGLVIPKDFTKDLKKLKSPKLMTVTDGTQLSSASFLKVSASEILLSLKGGVLIDVMRGKFNMSYDQAKNAVMAIDITSRILGNPTRNYVNFLLPGMILSMVQAGMGMTAAAALDKSSQKNIFLDAIVKMLACSGLGLISTAMILWVQIRFFDVPMKANFGKIGLLCGVFCICVCSIGIMLSSIFKDKMLASQVAAVYFLPSSILSGYTWPLLSMPVFFQKFAFFLPFTHFGELLRDLLLKGHSNFYFKNVTVLFSMAAIAIGAAMAVLLCQGHILRREAKSLEADGGN